jgi:hypothetical protein
MKIRCLLHSVCNTANQRRKRVSEFANAVKIAVVDGSPSLLLIEDVKPDMV